MTDSVGTLTLQALKCKHRGKFLMQIKPQPHFPLPLSHHAGTSEQGDTNRTALAVPTAPRGSTSGTRSTKQTSSSSFPRRALSVQQMLTEKQGVSSKLLAD